MGNNTRRLGSILIDRMQKTAKRNTPTSLELGTINSDMSLSVDGLSNTISPRDYMVDIRLTNSDNSLPSAFRKIRPGDRVLVAWVGYEPIIVSIVVAGTTQTS